MHRRSVFDPHFDRRRVQRDDLSGHIADLELITHLQETMQISAESQFSTEFTPAESDQERERQRKSEQHCTDHDVQHRCVHAELAQRQDT